MASRTILPGCSRFDRPRLPSGKSSRRQRCSRRCCCNGQVKRSRLTAASRRAAPMLCQHSTRSGPSRRATPRRHGGLELGVGNVTGSPAETKGTGPVEFVGRHLRPDGDRARLATDPNVLRAPPRGLGSRVPRAAARHARRSLGCRARPRQRRSGPAWDRHYLVRLSSRRALGLVARARDGPLLWAAHDCCRPRSSRRMGPVSLLEFALLTLWGVGLMLGRTPILMKRRPSRDDA
jgi:hypothetical protein